MSAAIQSPFAAADLASGHPLATVNRAPDKASPIDALCDAAVARLGQRLPPSLRVEHFPNKPSEYDFEGSHAAVLVIYDGSRFEKDGQLGQQGIQEVVRLMVVLLVRDLRGPRGAYTLTHSIRTALHGQSLAGLTGLRPIEIDLEKEDEGVYRYRLEFEGRLPAVPVRTPAQPVPPTLVPSQP